MPNLSRASPCHGCLEEAVPQCSLIAVSFFFSSFFLGKYSKTNEKEEIFSLQLQISEWS